MLAARRCVLIGRENARWSLTSQLIDQVITPRKSGYGRAGFTSSQPVAVVRQSNARLMSAGGA